MSNLTIGLPVYNGMPLLEESLESLLTQTDRNFKILVIDDGSTDAGLKYLHSVRDSRLRVVTQPNRGLTLTLNRMLQEVDTPWLMRHDADDIALPGRVAITKRAIDGFPDAAMFYFEARYYQDGRSVGAFRTTRATPERLRMITAEGYLPAICHPTVTMNAAKVLALGGYRFDLHIEDLDLWWRMALQYNVQYIPEVVTYFRHNLASVSTSNLEAQSINALYVQYLLLSHLHGWPPLSYEQVHEKLQDIVDRPRLKFRAQTRLANISYAQREYWKAFRHLVRAAIASPSALARRALYEVRDRDIVFNGENPQMFLRDRQSLWPGAPVSRSSLQSATSSSEKEARAGGDDSL
jgi:glycosyltransferase involved in cell wall biosynthesis